MESHSWNMFACYVYGTFHYTQTILQAYTKTKAKMKHTKPWPIHWKIHTKNVHTFTVQTYSTNLFIIGTLVNELL